MITANFFKQSKLQKWLTAIGQVQNSSSILVLHHNLIWLQVTIKNLFNEIQSTPRKTGGGGS